MSTRFPHGDLSLIQNLDLVHYPSPCTMSRYSSQSAAVSRSLQKRSFSSTHLRSNTQASRTPKSKAKPDFSVKSKLPRESVRSLVSLYHAATSFITPANLNDVIDKEFATSNQRRAWNSSARAEENIGDLNLRLHQLRTTPKYTVGRRVIEDMDIAGVAQVNQGKQWSLASMSPRSEAVKAALWGVSGSGSLPGLESLEENTLEKAQKAQVPDQQKGSNKKAKAAP